VPNLEKMGYAVSALIGLKVRPGRSDEVGEAIARLEETHYVAITTGTYDVMVWARVTSTDALAEFLWELSDSDHRKVCQGVFPRECQALSNSSPGPPAAAFWCR
jgi:DNA-binding Lrp family transcriptional regulator